jgi:hypothetical protein
MSFYSNVSSFAHQRSSSNFKFDPESWREAYGHRGVPTFGANAETNGHYGVVYPTNALGLTSDLQEVDRDNDRLPTQTMGGYFNNGVAHPVSVSFVRSLWIIDWSCFLGGQDPYLAPSFHSSGNVVPEQQFIDEISAVYNPEGQAVHYPSGFSDASASIAGDRYWQFSSMQQEPGHHPSHSYSSSHNALPSGTQNVNSSYSSTLPKVHNYHTGVVPQIVCLFPSIML